MKTSSSGCPVSGQIKNEDGECAYSCGKVFRRDGSCNATCDYVNDIAVAQKCQCGTGFQEGSSGCVCSANKFISADLKTCDTACPANEKKPISGQQCSTKCGLYQTEVSGQCVCKSNFQYSTASKSCELVSGQTWSANIAACTAEGRVLSVKLDSCVEKCGDGEKVAVSGNKCVAKCGLYQTEADGKCSCKEHFAISGDDCVLSGYTWSEDTLAKKACLAEGRVISYMGTSCDASCPEASKQVAVAG